MFGCYVIWTCRQELELARRSAAEAGERAARAARAEDEAKLRAAGLDKDMARCAALPTCHVSLVAYKCRTAALR